MTTDDDLTVTNRGVSDPTTPRRGTRDKTWNIKQNLGVMDLADIMEPVTETLSSMGAQSPFEELLQQQNQVFLDMATLISMKKESPKLFLTWLGRCKSLCIHWMGSSKHREWANSESISLIILQAESTGYYLTVWNMMDIQLASRSLTSLLAQFLERVQNCSKFLNKRNWHWWYHFANERHHHAFN